MKSRFLKVVLAFALVVSMLSVFASNPREASACYPAYKCMKPPTSYTLVYQSPDRRKGLITGGVVLGGLSFIGTATAVITVVIGTSSAIKEAYYGSLSFKTYVKKSDKKGYRFKVKTVYYKSTKYRDYYKTVYSYSK